MSYKHKYQNALETVREILDSGSDSIKMSRLKLRFQSVFSELKEKSNEEMWKLLKKYAHYNISDVTFKTDNITREQLESWLEKQSSEFKKLEVFTKHGDGMYYLHNNDFTYFGGNQTSDIEQEVKSTFHSVSSESKESDDEKCKEALVDYFKRYNTCGAKTFNGIPTDKILTWLETHKYTEEDLDRAYKCADKVQYMSGYNDARNEIIEAEKHYDTKRR